MAVTYSVIPLIPWYIDLVLIVYSVQSYSVLVL